MLERLWGSAGRGRKRQGEGRREREGKRCLAKGTRGEAIEDAVCCHHPFSCLEDDLNGASV